MLKKRAGKTEDIVAILDRHISKKIFLPLQVAREEVETSGMDKSEKGKRSTLAAEAEAKAQTNVMLWAKNAADGVLYLLSKIGSIASIQYTDVGLLFGTKSPEKVWQPASAVATILASLSKEEYVVAIESIVTAFMTRDAFSRAQGAKSVANAISEAKTALGPKKETARPEKKQEQREQRQEEQKPEDVRPPDTTNHDPNAWYVSGETDVARMFRQGTKFYGGFKDKITANVFSLLVNDSAGHDLSVKRGEDLIKINGLDLTLSIVPSSSDIGNHILAGKIDSEIEKYVASRKNVKLPVVKISLSGNVFDCLTKFIDTKCPFGDRRDPHISEIVSWYESKEYGISKFPEFYYFLAANKITLDGTSQDLDSIDPAIHGNLNPDQKADGQKAKHKKDIKITNQQFVMPTGKAPEKLNESTPLVVENISIFSAQDSERLTNELVLKYIEELRTAATGLESIDMTQIARGLNQCVERLDLFFRSILYKDSEINKQLVSFRVNNPLNIAVVSATWEFTNNFSLAHMLAKNKDIVNNLASFIGKIIYQKRQLVKPNINEIIGFKIDKYQRIVGKEKVSPEEKEEIISGISSTIITDLIAMAPELIIKKLTVDFSQSISAGSAINDLMETIIKGINLDAIAEEKIKAYFSSKSETASILQIDMIKCGVCDQVFSVPTQHIEALKKFNKNTKNYSFFRADNSLITEDELIGDMTNQKAYTIDDATIKLLVDDTTNSDAIGRRKTKRRRGGKEVVIPLSDTKKTFTWLEVNAMIYSPSGIKDQIDGQIIRNYILSSLGASVTGQRGMLTNKTLCAASLYNITSEMTMANPGLVSGNDNYACRASVMASYDPVPTAKNYQASSYIMPFGNSARSSSVEKYPNRLGYMFSRNTVRCPCLIDSKSSVLETSLKTGRKSYVNMINFIAVPKLPQSYLSQLNSDILFKDSEIYSAPTNPEGGQDSGLPAAYVICGRNTSLSMFDRDPSSQNYIQTFFSNLLKSSGQDALVGAVKLMLSYGIEMNDIKPHIEAVLDGDQDINITSRKEMLKTLIKKSRKVIAQEASSVDINILGDLGMICEHGHKFTLRQSWDFAKTHLAIKLTNDTLVRNKELKEMIDNPFKAMIDSKMVGVFNVSVDEAALRSNGFKQPAEIASLSELKQLMNDKKLYFKSDDGVLYTIKQPRFSSLDDAPWSSNKILIQKQFPGIFKRFVTTDSMTQDGEEDGSGPSQGDVADASILSPEDQLSDTREAMESANLDFAEIIIPDISDSIRKSIEDNAQDALNIRSITFASSSKDFIDNLLKTLKISRSWCVMAADYQIDFMRGGNPELIRDPELKSNIAAALDPLSEMVGLKTSDYETDFYQKYDVDSLISTSEEIAHDKFLSLATFARYYDGFSVPFIANLKPDEARSALIASLKTALIGSLPGMLNTISRKNIDVASPILNSAAETIATLLLSPYDKLFSGKSDYKYLMENAVVDYTARAYTFSFAIDMADKLKMFLSRYFFNEESSLYIGPFSGTERSAIDTLNDMLKMETVGTTSASNLLLMDEKDFTSRMLQLRSSLNQLYNFDNLFKSYMNHKNLVISGDENQLMAQKAVVAMRFSTLLSAASNSIGAIIRGLTEKPLNSPGIVDAAKVLDNVTNSLIRRRDPVNYEALKKRMDKTADRFDYKEHIFEQNAAGFARINLSPTNISLAPIAFLDKDIREILVNVPRVVASVDPGDDPIIVGQSALSVDYLNNDIVKYSEDKRPYLYFIKKIKIVTQAGAGKWQVGREAGNKELYICVVPDSQGPLPGINLMDYLQFDNSSVINLNTSTGREFVERYVSGINQSKNIILIDPSLLDLKTKSAKSSARDIMKSTFDSNPSIGKIYKPMMNWPPPNNLLYNNYDIARNPSSDMFDWRGFGASRQHESMVGAANKYYAEKSNIENHTDFMATLTEFPASIGSKTMDVSSSHGVLIPLKLENQTYLAKTGNLDNTVWRDQTDVRQDSLFISKASIKVKTDSGNVLDMLWAFKALDPQFYDEGGQVKSQLVQSGAVQKLEYIKLQMSQIYNWIESNAKNPVMELLEQSFSSFEEFLSIFFSSTSVCVRITTDLTKSVKAAALITSTAMIGNVIEKKKGISIYAQINELMTKLVRLVDLYNAAQVLNLEYSKLRPQLNMVNSIDLSNNSEIKSLSLKVLDPFSLWKMITNPAMSTDFGGPINPANVEDYKAFVISAFGINELLGKVCDETTLTTNRISAEDLFDLPGFCERYISKYSKDAAITRFIDMFHLELDDTGAVKTYINGYPMIFAHSGKLEEMTSSLNTKQFELHESSYVEHLCRTKTMFESLTAKDMKDPTKLAALKERIIALQNGTESSTLDELLSLVTSIKNEAQRYSAGGKSAPKKAGDMEALRIALLKIANRAYFGTSRPLSSRAQKSLSWRKIAQDATNDDSIMELRGLYDALQQQILNIMATMAG